MKWLTLKLFKWALPGMTGVQVISPKPGRVIAFCFKEYLGKQQVDLIREQLDLILPKFATYIVLQNGAHMQAVDFNRETRGTE